MGTVSVSIPDDLREKMTKFDEVNWSAVARKAFEEKVKEIEFLKGLAYKSKLTEHDAAALSDKIKKHMSKTFIGMH